MVKGKVTFFHKGQKYGFIEKENKNEEIFFHADELSQETQIRAGLKLEFEIEFDMKKGPKAVNASFSNS